ncbi:response regulator [Solimonas sp. K1W22B-7]|uniref:response regulator n=1 Tax=Solimonas sp. K1W22B-7 TaxID=2303331 RepID=UPI000E334745|nr:response regulator [Solimonas sp. K1W22B-7]AXQ30982.1 response regulator [Solimonas sp. K1W22B-7]
MVNKTALIVDDSRSARFALRRHLEHHAYKVDTAESAEEAYTFLKDHQPEVIFLDHVMPGTDGFTALQHIKRDPATVGIPVVICSSNEGVDFNAEARAKGASDVLQKPPSPEQLTRVLENLQQFAADLKLAHPQTPAAAPAAGKVTSLREPDVTIGQAVLNVLRNTLGRGDEPSAAPPPAAQAAAPAPAPPPARTPVAPPPVAVAPVPPPAVAAPVAPVRSAPPAAPAPAPAPAMAAIDPQLLPSALREQLETRLKKLTQDVFHQVSEIKANLAVVESRLRDPDEDRELLESAARAGIRELQLRVESLESRVDARFEEWQARMAALLQEQAQQQQRLLQDQQHHLQQQMLQQQQQLQDRIDSLVRAQEEQARHIETVIEQARTVAAEEAHNASERTVMSAAARIADQLADSISKALGRK